MIFGMGATILCIGSWLQPFCKIC